MKIAPEQLKGLIEEESRLLSLLKERMLAGDDEEKLLEITTSIDEIKQKAERIKKEISSKEKELKGNNELEKLNISALRQEFEANKVSRVKHYKIKKRLSGILSLIVLVVGGAIGLIYAGPIGAMVLFGIGLIIYEVLTSKLWKCPVCGTSFKRGGMSMFNAKLSSQANCTCCGFSVREID